MFFLVPALVIQDFLNTDEPDTPHIDIHDRDNFFVDFEFLSGVDHNIWSQYDICERYKTRNPRDKENP